MKKYVVIVALMGAFLMFAGFNLDNAIVPKEKILSGGIPKDGIPALLEPKFINTEKADFMLPDDQVIGIRIGGEARAYPLRILNWHEVVNDTVNGVAIAVTF